MTFNLAAEVAALLIITVSIIGLLLDSSFITTRHRIFRWLYYCAFFTSFFTILAVFSQEYLHLFPIQMVVFFRYMFYITMPTAAIAALYYAISLVYTKTNNNNLLIQHFWGVIPYLVYILVLFSNLFNNAIFSYTKADGIIQGKLYRITYPMVVIYFIMIVVFVIKHNNSPRRKSLYIIILNLVVTAIVFCMQLVLPTLQMSGLASMLGILVIHLYIQNISKSNDELTELYNRQALTEKLNNMCKHKRSFSLYVISLRNIRGINERLGLEYGDALLETFSFELKKILPHKALFRYTGDEFAILTEEFSDGKLALDDLLSKQLIIRDKPIKLDTIVARVDYPSFGQNTKEIISAMDYSIATLKKTLGSEKYFYDVKVCERLRRRYDIIERLNHAIENDGFVPYYQGIFDVKSGKFTMAEALIRLKNNEANPVSPAEFIPIAEETGQIIKITLIMMEMVCSDYRLLLDKYGDNLPLKSISVNFPYAQFLTLNTVKDLNEILAKYELSKDRIKIELTERTLSSDLTATKEIITELVNNGFEFELDDFGVEYSSLSMFFDMPINIVKFDRSLVLNFTADESRKNFLKTFLEAVKSTRMKVVMEGVEDKKLLEFLIEIGADYIQGYIYAKPLPLNEFIDLINKQ